MNNNELNEVDYVSPPLCYYKDNKNNLYEGLFKNSQISSKFFYGILLDAHHSRSPIILIHNNISFSLFIASLCFCVMWDKHKKLVIKLNKAGVVKR